MKRAARKGKEQGKEQGKEKRNRGDSGLGNSRRKQT